MRDDGCALCGASLDGAGAYVELEAPARDTDHHGLVGHLCERHARVLADVVAQLRTTTGGEAHV